MVMYCVAAADPISERPFPIVEMTSAPSSAETTRPRPPKRLVPPITAAAIASSRIVPPPALRSTELRREAKMMPPMAAMPLEIAKTAIRMNFTLMPARCAASALPPTAYTCRPKVVRRAMNDQNASSATTSTPANGTPRA